MAKKIYFTVTGLANFFGKVPFSESKYFLLRKDSQNFYDDELLTAEMLHCGSIGYVANHPFTRAKGTISAGRLYDKIGKTAVAKLCFLFDEFAICTLASKKQEKKYYRKLKRFEDMNSESENLLERILSDENADAIVIRFIQSSEASSAEENTEDFPRR